MSKITVLNDKSIAFPVPKDSHSFRTDGKYVYMMLSGPVHELSEYYDEEMLPPGSWSILGRPEEITEEQWKGILEPNMGSFETASMRGYSLLKSKGLNPEKDSVIILVKQ